MTWPGALVILVPIAIGVLAYLHAVRRITETDEDKKTDHWRRNRFD